MLVQVLCEAHTHTDAEWQHTRETTALLVGVVQPLLLFRQQVWVLPQLATLSAVTCEHKMHWLIHPQNPRHVVLQCKLALCCICASQKRRPEHFRIEEPRVVLDGPFNEAPACALGTAHIALPVRHELPSRTLTLGAAANRTFLGTDQRLCLLDERGACLVAAHDDCAVLTRYPTARHGGWVTHCESVHVRVEVTISALLEEGLIPFIHHTVLHRQLAHLPRQVPHCAEAHVLH